MSSNEITYKKGAYIFVENEEEVSNIYIVKKGEISLKRSNLQLRYLKSNAKSGDIIGFISSATGHPRMEEAVAKTESTLLSFTMESLIALLRKNSHVAMKVLNNLANELRIYNDLMINSGKIRDMRSVDMKLLSLARNYLAMEKLDMCGYALKKYLSAYPHGKERSEAENLLKSLEDKIGELNFEPLKEGNNRLYSDRQVIFCEHEPGEVLYIIKEGKVKIVKTLEKSEIMLSILKEGDIFGELAIISDKPRNASAISLGRTKLLPVSKKALLALMNRSPEIVNKIFTSICQRIWFTYIRLESVLYKKAVTKIYTHLENKLMEDNISLERPMSHTFNFGIEELFTMLDLSQEDNRETLDKLLEDENLHFNFGQTSVEDSTKLLAKARYYKARDHIAYKKNESIREPEDSEIAEADPEKEETFEPVNTAPLTPVADKIIKREKKETEEGICVEDEESGEGRINLDIENCIKKLKDEKASIRNTAARRLGQFGRVAGFSSSRLVDALDDTDKDVRLSALKSLENIMSIDDAAELFKSLLKSGSSYVRSSAARGLGEIKLHNGSKEKVVMLLVYLLDDIEDIVKESAITSLASFREDSYPAIPALIKLLENSNTHLIKLAIDALALIATGGENSSLAAIALKNFRKTTKDIPLRLAAKNALRKISGHITDNKYINQAKN